MAKLWISGTAFSTTLAKPGGIWDVVHVDAVCVPEFAAAIAIHQDIFVVTFTALLANFIVFVFVGDFEEQGRVDLCDLCFILDCI